MLSRLPIQALQLTQKLDWLAPLLLRLFFGYFWLETGLAKVQHLEGFTQRFVEWGIPFPAFSAGLSAWTDLIGGALMMLGLCTRLAMIPMIINMLGAVGLVVIHNISDLDGFVETDELLYIVIFFWLMMAGPGRASLDALLWQRLQPLPAAAR